MNRAHWERSRDARAMLGVVGKANLDKARPSRLFACAAGRQVWHLLSDELGRPSIEVVERFIEGQADWADLRREFLRIRRDSPPGCHSERAIYETSVAVLMMFSISGTNAAQVAQHAGQASRLIDRKDIANDQCELVREVFGDPFDPRPFDRDWITPTAVGLARDIHRQRAFDRMPILGDALEEAGCPDRPILDHCRGEGRHVRGCWVVEGAFGFR